MKMSNSELSLGYGLPHSSSGYQPYSSFGLPWEINSEVNHGLSVVAEQKREWLKMLNQQKLDQDFLNSFMQVHVVQQSQSPLKKMSAGLDPLVKEAERPISYMKLAEQTGLACSNWRTEHNPAQIKERLESENEQIIGRSTSTETQEKIMKRNEKRKWIKKKKERQRKEAEETIQRREQLNMLIDNQRDIIRRNELLRKRHQEAKRKANIVLSETRRKRSEVTIISQLLKSLRELRSLRARSLESRCALFSKQEDTDNFDSTLDKLNLVIQNKLIAYEEEETSWKLATNKQNHTICEETIQKLWNNYSPKGFFNIN